MILFTNNNIKTEPTKPSKNTSVTGVLGDFQLIHMLHTLPMHQSQLIHMPPLYQLPFQPPYPLLYQHTSELIPCKEKKIS